MKGIGQSTLSNENDQCDKATRVHSNIEKYAACKENYKKLGEVAVVVAYLNAPHLNGDYEVGIIDATKYR